MKDKLCFRVCMILLLLLISSCSKKQDLVEKAFEGKDFDNPLEQKDQGPGELAEEDEEKKSTEKEVLFDQLNKPKEGESIFPEDGDMNKGSTDRGPKLMFPKDLEAPLINLEETKLYDVINLLLEQLEVNYIIDPSVKDQSLSIKMVRSDRKLKTSDLLDLLLKLHDLTIVEHGSFINVVPIDASEVYPGLTLLYGNRPNESLRREELVMQIIPLAYVTPEEMTNVIKEFLSPSARVIEEPKNNVLIIIDKNHFLRKAMELIPIFDIDVLANKKMVLYKLAYVDADETAGKLEEILGAYGFEADGERLSIVPIETLNALLVVSSRDAIYKELDFWIEKLDKEAKYEADQVFVYKVENTTADVVSTTLAQIFGLRSTGGGGSSGNQNRRRSTDPNNQRGRNNTNQNQRNNQQGGLNSQTRNNQNQRNTNQRQRNTNQNLQGDGPLMIIDSDNNSLIFKTTAREYARIRKTLKKLDVLPRQVFLEVTVLSVKLDDTFSLGLDWNAQDNPVADDTSTSPLTRATGTFGGSNTGFGGAYSYTSPSAAISISLAAAKTKGYVNVLQQPHIMAIDNQPATLTVGTDIPIQTTTTNIQNVSAGQSVNPATSSTIVYKPTGVSLSFTPHINANGVIRLEISLDISSAGAQSSSAEAVPISQNSLATEMIVRDGQTVVMGGLIFDQEGWGRESVPLLGKIPILKHLFTKRTSNASRSELIVMITPRLIDSEEKSIAISKEFRDKILKEFDSFKDPGH